MNERWITVKRENHGFVGREDRIEFAVGESMRMFGRGLECHEIDDIDDANLDVRKILPQQMRPRRVFRVWECRPRRP